MAKAKKTQFDPIAWVKALWLVGEQFSEIASSDFYQSASIEKREHILKEWSAMEMTYTHVCSVYGWSFEPSRLVRTLKKPPVIR